MKLARCFAVKNTPKFADLEKLKNDKSQLHESLHHGLGDQMKQGETAFDEMPGMAEFKQSLHFENEKNFDEAEHHLKEGLKQLKTYDQDRTLGYLYLLRKLAHVSLLNRKFTESEKYFKITAHMTPMVTENPSHKFSSNRNLLVFYMQTNLQKAVEQMNAMQKDLDNSEYYASHGRQLDLLKANLHLLQRDHKTAKVLYKNQLKLATSDTNTAKILNNLAYATWQHSKELGRWETIPEETEEKKLAAKEKEFVVTWLKEAILKQESGELEGGIDLEKMQLVERLTSDGSVIPADLLECQDSAQKALLEQEYFGCLKSKNVGTMVTNLSEYLLEDLVMASQGQAGSNA